MWKSSGEWVGSNEISKRHRLYHTFHSENMSWNFSKHQFMWEDAECSSRFLRRRNQFTLSKCYWTLKLHCEETLALAHCWLKFKQIFMARCDFVCWLLWIWLSLYYELWNAQINNGTWQNNTVRDSWISELVLAWVVFVLHPVLRSRLLWKCETFVIHSRCSWIKIITVFQGLLTELSLS